MDCPFRRMASFFKRRLSVSSVDIVEQTDVHEPWHYHSDSPISGDYYGSPPYSVCSSPPTGYQNWVVCQLNVPIQTFSFHNTSYVITANYHYLVFTGAYPPSPSNPMYRRVDGSISITVNFQNLIVEAQPKILKWDPNVPENCDTTFSYSLSCAQKKNCNVTIQIYSTEGNLVYQTNLTQLCPGTYTFTWDGTNNQLPPSAPSNIAPAGLYTFDIQVQGACPYDQDSFRSSFTRISMDNLSIDLDPDNPPNYKFGYVLESVGGVPASWVWVNVYAPAVENFEVRWGGSAGTHAIPLGSTPTEDDWNYVSFPQDVVKVGGSGERVQFYVVVSGYDNDVNNKKHQKKTILERNQENARLPAALFYCTKDNAAWWFSASVGSMALMSGAFRKEGEQVKEGFLRFTEKWYGWYGAYYSLFNITEPASYVWVAQAAIVGVDVFAYFGHGNGRGILFNDGALTEEQLPQTSTVDLAVIGSCVFTPLAGNGFPFVASLVSKGVRFGIGVTGMKASANGW